MGRSPCLRPVVVCQEYIYFQTISGPSVFLLMSGGGNQRTRRWTQPLSCLKLSKLDLIFIGWNWSKEKTQWTHKLECFILDYFKHAIPCQPYSTPRHGPVWGPLVPLLQSRRWSTGLRFRGDWNDLLNSQFTNSFKNRFNRFHGLCYQEIEAVFRQEGSWQKPW